MNPLKRGLRTYVPLYSGQTLCPQLRLPNTSSTSEEWTSLKFIQQTVINPRLTLAYTKVPVKTDNETIPIV